MGIAFCLVRVKPELVERLRGKPRAVAEYIFGDASLGDPPAPGLFAWLFGKARKAPPEAPVALPERVDGDETDVDKAWNVIHYMLTGSDKWVDDPLGLIMDDRDPIAEVDAGLGRPSVIAPPAVAAFVAALAPLTEDAFLARFVPAEMPVSKLYLGKTLASEPREQATDYLLANFRELRDFTAAAAEKGDAIITYYC